MTQSHFAAFVLLLVCAISTAAESTFPQMAAIGAGGATLRCGPGDSFYATDELKAGTEVEVWQRREGWLAIRPPDSSFSLVPAASLRRTAGSSVAEVTGSNVVSWIGSHLEHTGDCRWQVQLEAGEKVVVLGTTQQRLHQEADEQSLARIAPPAGEFRWISDRDLQEPVPAKESAAAESPVRLAEYQMGAAAELDEASKPTATDGFVARKGAASPVRTADRLARSAQTKKTAAEPDFDKALRDAELRLSLMAAQPASGWDFESLRDEAQSLVDRGESTLERARAQRLLDQIEDFDSLKQRFVSLHGEPTAEVTETTAEADAGQAEPLVDPRFDGTGWLFPVYSRQRVAPPYALLDDEGQIVQFISPAPGLNVHGYLRKQIGVYGEKSFPAGVNKPHVVAHRVVDLDRHRR